MKTWIVRLVCLALLAAMGIAATGCNTVRGFGEDISGTSDAAHRAMQ